jgi:hypothetical protein
MGLILDSSVLITAERQGQNARQMLAAIVRTAGNTDIAISVVTLIELAHGAARADTAQRKEKRHQFIHELGGADSDRSGWRKESADIPEPPSVPIRHPGYKSYIASPSDIWFPDATFFRCRWPS